MTTVGQMDMFGAATHAPAQPLPGHLNHDMREPWMHKMPGIGGLYYYPGFLDDEAQRELVECIDAGRWRRDLERRVQHYGWRYDYRTRAITADMDLGPLPDWVAEIAERLFAETKLFDRIPDQAIVNEYYPGQGIALHADRNCFGGTVATVSLGDDWEMKMRPVRRTSAEDRLIMLIRGSVLVLTGDSRTRWMHGIDKRKKEKDRFGQRDRRRRLSLTFRTVLDRSEEGRQTEGYAAGM